MRAYHGRVPVLIVGGGLGGLTTALALHRVGQTSRLIMREQSLTQSGGAVLLMKNALRILDRLGLGSCVRTIGTPLQHTEVMRKDGRPILSWSLDAYSGSEVYAVPRAELRHAFLMALPPDVVTFGTRVSRVHCKQDGASVALRDSSSEADLDAGLVIGADGGRSTVRSCLARPGASTATNVVAFRALTRNRDLKAYPLHVIREVWGSEGAGNTGSARFGVCRVTPSNIMWWATLAVNSDGPTTGSDLLDRGIVLRPFVRKLATVFKDWPLQAHAIIQAAHEGAVERTELRKFRENNRRIDDNGCIVLVGDAARQSDVPYFHHGGSMAIEDGYSIAMALDEQVRSEGSLKPLEVYCEEREQHDEYLQDAWAHFQRLAVAQNPLSQWLARKRLDMALARHNVASDAVRTDGLERIKAMQFDARGRLFTAKDDELIRV